MNKFFLCKTTEIEVNQSRLFQLPGGKLIALFRTKTGYYAVENRCPHAGGSLAEGRLKKDVLMCVWHGWEFNLRTRECLTQPGAMLQFFPLEIKGEDIYLNLNSVLLEA